MFIDILILILGLILVIVGADFFVNGATGVAKRFNMPEFLIGLTIVGIGTSMPELVVSFMGAIKGNSDVALGNVIGSNLANVLLILGASIIIAPIAVSKRTLKFDLSVNLLVSIVLLIMCFGFVFWQSGNRVVERWEGILLLAIFTYFMFASFSQATSKKSKLKNNTADKDKVTESDKTVKLWLALIMIVGGLAGLIIGGNFFVNGATSIARSLGVSDYVIAVTTLAMGTSLPELATSIVAAIKGKMDMVLGNIIGSNISNITLILGICATVSPLSASGVKQADILIVILSALILIFGVIFSTRKRLNYKVGIILVSMYVAYVSILVLKPELLSFIL